ncbi:unnamed protein product [Durusdinium trenchii]|uniref:Uncharacterized protein n=1 Tax=Durusdinium trenchii TaxID=1381693 RepID=A0ABP0QFS2_9DINO
MLKNAEHRGILDGGYRGCREIPLKETTSVGCPYARDENARCPARHEGMALDVISKLDVPPGPLQFHKDYDRSLLTEDLDRAQPLLSHPTSFTGAPIPWKDVQKPPLEEVPKSRSNPLYPPVKRRPRDLSLKTSDIDYAQPKKPIVSERRRSNCIVDLLTNSYQFTSSEVPVQPDFRTTGRCAMDCSDIEGTWPHPLPAKSVPQDPMKIEDEFRNPRHHSVLAAASASLLNTGSLSARGPRASERAGLERWEVNPLKVGQRQGHPLSPRYHLPVAEAGTSMHVRFQCERHDLGDHPPPTQCEEVGFIDGSKPKTEIRDNGEPQFNLCTEDVPGAQPRRRVGVLPVHLYGPPGNRPQSNSLQNADIEGAQADTRMTVLRRRDRGAGGAGGRPAPSHEGV